MLRIALLSLVLSLAVSHPALAESPDERLCVTWAANDQVQLDACTRALAQDGLSVEAKLALHDARAYLYGESERYAEAIADYDAAIALAPEKASLYRDRGQTYSYMKKWEAALADLDRSLELEPDYVWSWYARGFMLERLGRDVEALASYDQALTLSPLNWTALDGRAKFHLTHGNNALAVADFSSMLQVDPYYTAGYVGRGIAFERLGDAAQAVRDYRVGELLDPNYYETDEGLDRLGGKAEARAIEPQPLSFAPPAAGLAITFLEVQIDPKAEKDEMEAAIGDLVGWFSGNPGLALPLESHFLRRAVTGVELRLVTVEAALLHPEWDDDQPQGTQQIVYIDGLWPNLLPTKGNVRAEIRYDHGALAKVWELPLGQQAGGTAKLIAICPDEEVRDPMAAMIGCTPGKRVPLGKVVWDVTPEAWEEVLVPAGRFVTLKLRHHETAELTIAGQTVTRQTVALWWWSPEVGWFVRRRLNEEDKVRVIEAVTIERPQ